MHDLFLSYARADDEPFVHKLFDNLTRAGFDVWFDREKMPSRGEAFTYNIERAVQESQRLALIVGPQALTSHYVTQEWRTAMEACIPVIPILRLSGYDDLPSDLRLFDSPDFRNDSQFDTQFNYLKRQIADPVPPLGELHGLRWFAAPRGYISRVELWNKLDKAVRGPGLSATPEATRVLVTALQGIGGLGKTTLAAIYAMSCVVRRRFDDGVYWLHLGREADPLAVMSQLGDMLGDSSERYTNLDIATRRLNKLIEAKRVLLILDDAWDHQPINHLRKTLGAHCRLLYTTRNPGIVALTEALRVRMDTMSVDEGSQLISTYLSSPDAHHDGEAERGIVVLLGGHTLAIKMAAANIDAREPGYAATLFTAYQKAKETTSPFADLQLAKDDKDYNVELSLALSYDSLSEDNQWNFEALGVLAENANFTIGTAAALWEIEISEAKRKLRELEFAALVQPESDGTYSQHSLLHAYAAALLRQAETYDETFNRYADFVIDQSQVFDTLPLTDWDQIEWLMPHVNAVGDTLSAAFAQLPPLDNPPQSEAMQMLLTRLGDFAFYACEYVIRRVQAVQRDGVTSARGMNWLENGLAIARYKKDPEREGILINNLALLWDALGEKRKAITYHEQTLELFKALEDEESMAAALTNIGLAWYGLGDLRQALNYHKQAWELIRNTDNAWGKATTLNNIGAVVAKNGDYAKARDYYERAIPLFEVANYPIGVANVLNNLGFLEFMTDNFAIAIDYFQRALQSHLQLRQHAKAGNALNNIGQCYLGTGEYEKAQHSFEQALELMKEEGDRLSEATVLNNFGEIWLKRNEANKALDYFQQAITTFRAIENQSLEATTLIKIGTAFVMLEDSAKARESYEHALQLRKELNDSPGEAEVKDKLAALDSINPGP